MTSYCLLMRHYVEPVFLAADGCSCSSFVLLTVCTISPITLCFKLDSPHISAFRLLFLSNVEAHDYKNSVRSP